MKQFDTDKQDWELRLTNPFNYDVTVEKTDRVGNVMDDSLPVVLDTPEAWLKRPQHRFEIRPETSNEASTIPDFPEPTPISSESKESESNSPSVCVDEEIRQFSKRPEALEGTLVEHLQNLTVTTWKLKTPKLSHKVDPQAALTTVKHYQHASTTAICLAEEMLHLLFKLDGMTEKKITRDEKKSRILRLHIMMKRADTVKFKVKPRTHLANIIRTSLVAPPVDIPSGDTTKLPIDLTDSKTSSSVNPDSDPQINWVSLTLAGMLWAAVAAAFSVTTTLPGLPVFLLFVIILLVGSSVCDKRTLRKDLLRQTLHVETNLGTLCTSLTIPVL